MSISSHLGQIKSELPDHVHLIAVSKTYPPDSILEAYHAGQKAFGENKVQEMVDKQKALPADIEWHLIGHLQSNKVKYIATFVHMIHSVDSVKLLKEINRQAEKNKRVIHCLLQIHIAQEESKFGMSFADAESVLRSEELKAMRHVKIVGLMGMATLTEDEVQIRNEFRGLKNLFDQFAKMPDTDGEFKDLSMGMSSDFRIAIEEGSNMIRIGSSIFGSRQ